MSEITVKQRTFSAKRIWSAAFEEATGAKTSAYLITTILTGVLFAGFSNLVLSMAPTSIQTGIWGGLSILFAILFSPIRYALEEMIRETFPSTDYNSHLLVKRLNLISYSSLTLERLASQFFQEFEVNLEVSNVMFLILSKDGSRATRHHGFSTIPDLSPTQIEELVRATHGRPTKIKQIQPRHLQDYLKSHKVELIVPLMNNESLLGILVMGEKAEGHPFTTKDIKVLEAISPKVGFAIQNALEYERVTSHNQQLISHLESANEKLRHINKELKHADNLKDEFIYVATHELKNPVTAMRGYLSLIEEGHYGKVPENLSDPFNEVMSANQQLITLLNNLLQIARVEAEKIEIKAKPVPICEVMDLAIKEVKALAQQKGLVISHACLPNHPHVMAERERLREILSNLLTNAIKYSDKGVITVFYELKDGSLITHVKDEGVGIPEKDQPMIFTRFFRVEEEAAKGIPGSGLGLFIIKTLLERMEGKIWFESSFGKGSIFSFSLPTARSHGLRAE